MESAPFSGNLNNSEQFLNQAQSGSKEGAGENWLTLESDVIWNKHLFVSAGIRLALSCRDYLNLRLEAFSRVATVGEPGKQIQCGRSVGKAPSLP